MGATMGKGSDAERELSNLLEDEYDYACLRAPASGGATDRARPDLVALKVKHNLEIDHSGYPVGDGEIPNFVTAYAIELKSNSDGTAHLDSHEVAELEEWAYRAGAKALVGVKPDLRSYDQWFFLETGELNETKSGNYSLNQSHHDKAKSIEEQFGH